MCQYFKILKVIINLVVISVCVGKIALFDKALVVALARGALAMCAMWVGLYVFHFSIGKHFITVAVVFFSLAGNVLQLCPVAVLRASSLSVGTMFLRCTLFQIAL